MNQGLFVFSFVKHCDFSTCTLTHMPEEEYVISLLMYKIDRKPSYNILVILLPPCVHNLEEWMLYVQVAPVEVHKSS